MNKTARRQTRSSKRKEDVIPPDKNEGTDSSEEEEDAYYVSKEDLPETVPSNNVPEDEPDGKTEKIQAEGHGGSCISILVLLSIPCIVVALGFAPDINLSWTGLTGRIDIENSLEQLANDFQSQSPLSYKKLRSRALTYIHHKTSPQPFVLMVASMPDDQHTADCFVNRVAKLLTTTTVTINGSEYSETKSDDAKLQIDDRLRNVFQEGKFPTAAVIHNLDLIPYGTTTLFYAYCDHDNPMYKEAAIIFTITLPKDYEINDDEHERERLVEKYIVEDSPWVKDTAFSLDIMGALISRITDTIIVVNKESAESLKKHC